MVSVAQGRSTVQDPARARAQLGFLLGSDEIELYAGCLAGVLDIAGSPAPHSYWELSSGSGAIDLDVPSSASFRLHAVTHSGKVSTDLPIAIEEQSGKEIRARLGSGDARVEARTSSGQIRIR